VKNLLLLVLVAGCAQVTSLNLRKHQFGQQPTKIIIIQIAGLDHEHFSMLKFGFPTTDERTSVEEAMCVGLAWSYNLYNLRPNAARSMLSQVTGKKSIDGSCSDFAHTPLWGYLSRNGYKSGIFEIDATDEESIVGNRDCKAQSKKFLGDSILWSMRAVAPEGAEGYLPSMSNNFKDGKIYWDKTCRMNGCGSALRPSVTTVYSQFIRQANNHIFVVRDFSYYHALIKRDYLAAKEALRDLDKTIESFYKLTEGRSDILVVVTGVASLDVDFPLEGKDWQQFELKGANAVSRSSELVTPVFATGARAENFCGFYQESQVFERILSGPKQQGLELKVINPFN
jgi:hypothetical protein